MASEFWKDSPFGENSIFHPSWDFKKSDSFILQISITKKPIDFGGTLEFTITTNLRKGEKLEVTINDIDSIFSNTPDQEKDSELYKTIYTISDTINSYSIVFNSEMEKIAFEDTESDFAECYIKVKNSNISVVFSEVFNVIEGTTTDTMIKAAEYTPSWMKDDYPKKECKPLKLTTKQKAQVITIVLGESALGDIALYDIGYIYINLINRYGFENGMQKSSVYSEKSPNYKLFMYYFGYGKEFENFNYYSSGKLKDYIKSNEFLKKVMPKIKPLQDFLEKEIFCLKPMSPYYKWCGQGYTNDFNISDERSTGKWYKARQYYWLQIEKKVEKKLVKVLPLGLNTTYLFDEDTIIAFFIKNPNLLPKPNEIPLVE